jgi:hypothetical protein
MIDPLSRTAEEVPVTQRRSVSLTPK